MIHNSDSTFDLVGVLGDPARVSTIPSDLLPAAASHVGAVLAAVAAAMAAAHTATDASTAGDGADTLLTLEEAAEIANVSTRWLRRNRHLPFFVSLSRKNVRISENRFRRWLERRTGR